MKLAVYGKGGIGKSTTSCNISIALARRGKKVLQIGCDPKHDSTFTLTGFLIPTIIDTLQSKDYHYEDVWPEDVIYQGYGGVDCVEAGGPPAGAGCGGYVVGETVKLLKELNAFYEYDVILFDVLGDVVCGGFAAPLNYADYCIIITDNGFDALFAANRISASVREKARTHPLRLAGLVGNRTSKRDLIDKYVEACPMPVLEVLPLIEDIRISRVKGKTLFEMAEIEASLNYVCDFYLNIADQILAQPEGVVPTEVPDRELFSLLSDFYATDKPADCDSASAAEDLMLEVSSESKNTMLWKLKNYVKKIHISYWAASAKSLRLTGSTSASSWRSTRPLIHTAPLLRAMHLLALSAKPEIITPFVLLVVLLGFIKKSKIVFFL